MSQLVSRGREAVDKGRAAFDRTREKATSAASETYTETFGNSPYPTA